VKMERKWVAERIEERRPRLRREVSNPYNLEGKGTTEHGRRDDAHRASQKCPGCGFGYGDAEWRALPLRERIWPDELTRLVRDWPRTLCVEVRPCARCARSIAARRATEAGASGLR
jgi:hypothetical protein